MAVAKITLTGCATYSSKHGQYVRGQTKVCTNLEEIKYYKGVEGFLVELLTPLEEAEKFTSVVSPAVLEAESKKVEEERPDTVPMVEPPKPKDDSLPEIAAPTPREDTVKKEVPPPEPPSSPPPVVTERGKKRRKTAI